TCCRSGSTSSTWTTRISSGWWRSERRRTRSPPPAGSRIDSALRPVEQAGGIVFRGNDRGISILLVTSKKEDGHWIFPKGHIEPGESPEVAALRETSEEAGVDGELLGQAGQPLEFTWGGTRYRVRYFLIRARSETPRTDGRPGTNPKDIEFFAEAKHRTFRNARLAAFGSTRRKDTAAAADDQVQLLIDAGTPVVTIFGKTSLLHVREVLQTTPDENLDMIADTVRFLKQHGRFVVYDAEHAFDGFKEDAEYAASTLGAAEDAGADIVTLCDTNGGSLPGEIAAITRAARGILRVRLGIHTHDD